jgi:hypothetical protein
MFVEKPRGESENAGSREGRCRQQGRLMQHAAKGDAAACVGGVQQPAFRAPVAPGYKRKRDFSFAIRCVIRTFAASKAMKARK